MTKQEVLDESPFNDNYGVNRMQIALANHGIHAGKRRIMRNIWEFGWLHECRIKPKGLAKVTIEIQEEENLIKQDFYSEKPYQKLLTDVSQIFCLDETKYISSIMDCYYGEILLLCMRKNIRKELYIDTFEAAAMCFPFKDTVLHSNRGSQYTN